MSRRLHLGLECLGRDHQAEVRLRGGAARHGFVVRVEVRVVVDLEARWLEGGCDLDRRRTINGLVLVVQWQSFVAGTEMYLFPNGILHRGLRNGRHGR